jgi:hypothetical protein
MLQVIPMYRASRGPPDKKKFNDVATSIHVTVEHAFGMLKSHFTSLQGLQTLVQRPCDMNRAIFWIQGCMILHNILIGADDDVLDDPAIMAAIEAQLVVEREHRGNHEGALRPGVIANDATRAYVKYLCEQMCQVLVFRLTCERWTKKELQMTNDQASHS